MPLIEIIFIVIPIVAAMILALLVTFRVLARQYYWAVIPLALIAVVALLLTS